MHRLIRASLLLPAALAATSAHALEKSGSLRWRFDDISVRDPSGTRRRSSWFQGYNLDLGGALLHPAVGSFKTGGTYSQGADINQAVNINSPEQRVVDYRASAQMFSSFIRQYLRFDPNYSLQHMRLSGSPNISDHVITNRGWGFSSGLSLPKLPAVNVSRQYNTIKDPDGPNPTDQRLNLEREDLSYQLGRLRLTLGHEKRKTEDRVNQIAVPEEDTRRGSLEYNHYDIHRLGLQSFSMRSDYLRLASGGIPGQKSATGIISVRSQDARIGRWAHSLSYWNDSQRDLLTKSSLISHNAQFNSNRSLARGTFINALAGNMSVGRGGTSRSANLSPGLSLGFLDGRIATNANASAGWNRTGTGASYANDSLEARLSVTPRPSLNLFTEARTNGSQPLNEGGEGGRRSNRYGVGGSRNYAFGEASVRYDRTEQREFSQASRSVNDQVNLLGSASPLERLNATGGLTFSATKTDPGARYSSKNLRLGLDYDLRWGLQLFADASYADRDQYTANCGASYSLGKTQLRLKFQHQEMPSPSSFSYLSISLTRLL